MLTLRLARLQRTQLIWMAIDVLFKDPPADTARGAEAEPSLAVVAGGRVGEERSLIRGLARVEALDNEP